MIRESVAEALKSLLKVEDVPLNIPPQRSMGDLSSAICLALAKQRRRPPLEIAREVAQALSAGLPPYIKDVAVTPPGYLNFRVDWPGLAQRLLPEIVEKGGRFGQPPAGGTEKVFVEHTSVNPNKAMHIGHLRNAVLGDTVARVFTWLGHPTEVCNYIDDTGVQVVDVVTAFLYHEPPIYDGSSSDFAPFWAKAPREAAFDYFCWDLYSGFQKTLEHSSRLAEKKEEVLHQIEAGSHPVARFAKELAERIVDAHLETVGRLSIWYDLLNWESDIIGAGFWKATFDLLKEKGALRYEPEGPNAGCWVVPFGGVVETEEGVKSLDKILVRSNGSVTYTGKDVAYQLWKFGLLDKDFRYRRREGQAGGRELWTTDRRGEPGEAISRGFGKAHRVINVIDARQSYPQQVVVECLRQSGFSEEADRSHHLAYEVVNLSAQAARVLGVGGVEEGGEKKAYAMSGRQGTGVKARDFIDMVRCKVVEKADHEMEEDTVSGLAAAAIRYYLLKFTLESQIIFDFDDALKTTGDTGVYLEYAHARASSILRKASERGIDGVWDPQATPDVMTETERTLLDGLARFPSVVAKAAETLRVSQLTEYGLELASAFTGFYEHPDPGAESQVPFIQIQDPRLRSFRLVLVRAFQTVMGNVLDLLGMPPLQKI
jgi:arginyl-tRNA synthetase